jgi:hypothetical protein
MPRFIDRLLAEKTWKTESFNLPAWMFEKNEVLQKRAAGIREDLRRSTVLVIDNVAEYYYSHHTSPHGRMDGPDQFPQLAPPFPCAFYEYALKPSMYDVMFTDAENGHSRKLDQVGILILSVDAQQVRDEFPNWSGFLEERATGSSAKWVVFVTVFARHSTERDVRGPCTLLYIAVDSDGHATSQLRARTWGVEDDFYELLPEERQLAIGSLGSLAFPAFLATSFLHCRNVSTQQHVPPPKLSKAFNRRHGRPLVQFKTLTIEPMKEVLRKQGRVEENGLPKALHLCRGHFKDYRNSAGLFGKHKGLFWWDLHARGDLEHGAVVKDYAIKLAE